MRGGRDRFVDVVVAAAMAALLPACPRTGDGNAGTLDRPTRAQGDPRVLRVGNPSRGVDEQPDYDGQAQQLRARVVDRLPDPLPEVRQGCAAMLDAAAAMYLRVEGDGTAQAERLAATRAADLAQCTAETSAQAAACVTLLAGEDGGEFPWLLDQCTRAFPKA